MLAPTPIRLLADASDADTDAVSAAAIMAANLNPRTGLATDYLNHFNEVVMLLDLVATCPDVIEEIIAWRPASYSEHMARSAFRDRELALTVYDRVPVEVKRKLAAVTDEMTAIVLAAREGLSLPVEGHLATAIAEEASARLRPLVARAGAIILGAPETDGDADIDGAQTRIDRVLGDSSGGDGTP